MRLVSPASGVAGIAGAGDLGLALRKAMDCGEGVQRFLQPLHRRALGRDHFRARDRGQQLRQGRGHDRHLACIAQAFRSERTPARQAASVSGPSVAKSITSMPASNSPRMTVEKALHQQILVAPERRVVVERVGHGRKFGSCARRSSA
jgi:hypothetical protein